MNNTVTICGIEYVTDDALSGGDYAGCGYLARVNVEVLEKAAEEGGHGDYVMGSGFSDYGLERDVQQELDAGVEAPRLIMQSGGYGSVGALVRADIADLVELVEALENYPVLDEDALSEAEMELEEEAWGNYTARDFAEWIQDAADREAEEREDEELSEEVETLLDTIDGDEARGWFFDACSECNVYPEYESDGGVYYNGLDDCGRWTWEHRVRPLIEDARLEAADTPAAAVARAVRDGLIDRLI